MLKSFLAVALVVVAGESAWGQAAAPFTFEVASVKAAAPCCAPGQWRESKAGPDRIDFRYVTLRYCIAYAYRLKEYQVSGPPWIGETRYDLLAKGPEGTRPEQLPEMMQALLAERFQFAAHREKKDFNVFALLPGKDGPKLKEAPTEEGGARFGFSMSNTSGGRLEARHCDMPALAGTLPRLVGRPVVDLTGLPGRYDFDLEFAREDVNGVVPGTGEAAPSSEFSVSIFTSIQRIGLRLDARKLPLDTIVVDHAEKTPTEN